jgi:hypothetical protein
MVAVLGLSVVACSDDKKDDKADTGDEQTDSSDNGDTGTDTGDSGDGGGTEAADYVAAIAETSQDATLSADETECFAGAVVEALGVDAFEEAGVTPADIREKPDATPGDLGITFSDAQKEGFWTAANECVNLREKFLESMSAGQTLTDEQKACLAEGFDDEFVKTMVLASFTESAADPSTNPEVVSKLTEVMGRCGTAG